MAAHIFQVLSYLVLVVFTVVYCFEEDLSNDLKVQINNGKQHRVRRNVRPVEFEVDGEKYKFDFVLSDRDVFSMYDPVWLAKSKPGNSPNFTYELVEDSAQMINGHFYVDNDKKAVAFVHYDENQKKILYDGLFGESKDKHVIKSMQEHHRLRLRSGRRNGDHEVFKVVERSQIYPTPRKIDPFTEKLEKPLEKFYLKILVVVDNHLFKSLGNDVAATIKYVGTFWNAVDQKYLEIESPKVQIKVTGIIIAHDEKALNYIYQSQFIAKEKNLALTGVMLEQTRFYFHYDFPKDMDFQNYDVAFVMTGQNVYPYAGETHLGKICSNWYNDAIVGDDGAYAGVQVATHELAHLLNVEHDPFKDSECLAKTADGSVSVMSPMSMETDNLFWSQCTKNYMQEFAKVKASECLREPRRERYYEDDSF